MKRAWWKFAIGILVVFGAGTIFGFIGTIVLFQNLKEKLEDPEIYHSMAVDHLEQKLDLSEAQREEVSVILEDAIGEIVPIRNETRRKLAEVLNTHGPRIRSLLDSEQEEAYDQFLQRLAKDWNVVSLRESAQSAGADSNR